MTLALADEYVQGTLFTFVFSAVLKAAGSSYTTLLVISDSHLKSLFTPPENFVLSGHTRVSCVDLDLMKKRDQMGVLN